MALATTNTILASNGVQPLKVLLERGHQIRRGARWNRKMFFGSLLPEEGQIAKPARWRNYKKGRQPQGFGRVG
jgi:hypothetical protein